jgi:hypothetical protein
VLDKRLQFRSIAQAIFSPNDGVFPKTKFTQKLYQRLSNCFSHIAEYDRDNFYAVWFAKRNCSRGALPLPLPVDCFDVPAQR